MAESVAPEEQFISVQEMVRSEPQVQVLQPSAAGKDWPTLKL